MIKSTLRGLTVAGVLFAVGLAGCRQDTAVAPSAVRETPRAAATRPVSPATAPAVVTVRPLMRDLIGINAHTIQFNPELYSPVCRLVRDFHPLTWDIDGDTSIDTTFPLARSQVTWKDDSGRFRDFAGKPDWKEIYQSWQKAGFSIDATLMLDNFAPAQWKNLPADAYKYGKAFASYFGPSNQKLVEAFEIGNEPSIYGDATYRTLFENMARGLREGDPKLTIVTAAALDAPSKGTRKSLSTVKGLESLYDVINIHSYAHKYQNPKRWPLWLRSYPEDPDTGFRYLQDIKGVIAWRNANAPGKQLWITEFGWDASSRQPDETGTASKWTDVSDEHQAQYIVRSFMLFAAMGIDRAYLFWFNDSDIPGVHASSGITRFNEPKFSYWAMKHLYQALGEYRFSRAVQETAGELYIYEFSRDKDPQDVIWAVWSPTDTEIKKDVKLTLPADPSEVQRMPMSAAPIVQTALKKLPDGQTQFEVNGSPLYLHMHLPAPAAK